MLLPKQIVALKKIVAKAASRLGLAAVRIERHERGPRAIATDGRRAVIFQWDEPDAEQFPPIEGTNAKPARQFAANVPPQSLAEAVRGIPRRAVNPILRHLLLDESDPSTVKVAASGGDSIVRGQVKAADGNFPDVESALPAPARDGNLYDASRHGKAAFTHTRIGVNAKQFAETLRVVSDLASDDADNTVVMTVPVDHHRPIRLDARCTGRRAAAAIMPVNAEFKRYDEPDEPKRLDTSRAPRQIDQSHPVNELPDPPSRPMAKPGRTRSPKRSRRPAIEFEPAAS